MWCISLCLSGQVTGLEWVNYIIFCVVYEVLALIKVHLGSVGLGYAALNHTVECAYNKYTGHVHKAINLHCLSVKMEQLYSHQRDTRAN